MIKRIHVHMGYVCAHTSVHSYRFLYVQACTQRICMCVNTYVHCTLGVCTHLPTVCDSVQVYECAWYVFKHTPTCR